MRFLHLWSKVPDMTPDSIPKLFSNINSNSPRYSNFNFRVLSEYSKASNIRILFWLLLRIRGMKFDEYWEKAALGFTLWTNNLISYNVRTYNVWTYKYLTYKILTYNVRTYNASQRIMSERITSRGYNVSQRIL
jgi:hypothetical protein